jgi:hypothetical protein
MRAQHDVRQRVIRVERDGLLTILPARLTPFLRQLQEVIPGLQTVFFISVAALAWLLAWSWERIRFRCQLVREGTETRFLAANRPQETLPEKVRDGILDFATPPVRAADRR